MHLFSVQKTGIDKQGRDINLLPYLVLHYLDSILVIGWCLPQASLQLWFLETSQKVAWFQCLTIWLIMRFQSSRDVLVGVSGDPSLPKLHEIFTKYLRQNTYWTFLEISLGSSFLWYACNDQSPTASQCQFTPWWTILLKWSSFFPMTLEFSCVNSARTPKPSPWWMPCKAGIVLG